MPTLFAEQQSVAPRTTASVEPVLDVRGLEHGFRRRGTVYRPVFRGLDLQVGRGEVVALLGASGCGKSTLLSIVAGLAQPTGGDVFFQGRRLSRPDPAVGFLFQQPALLPWLNARANVALGLNLRRMPRLSREERNVRLADSLRSVGLEEAGGLWPRQLSGGMAQRVALARTLARQPSLLLLDEPFSALDAITRLEMQKLLLRLIGERHLSVLLVTHDLDEALLLGDRVILLGGSPAGTLGEWQISEPKPRFATARKLTPLRYEILSALSRSVDLSQHSLS